MKNHRIIDSMEFISDEIIIKADEYPKKAAKKNRRPLFFSLGGVCAAAIAGIIAFRGGLFGPDRSLPTDSAGGNSVSSTGSSDIENSSASSSAENSSNTSVPEEPKIDWDKAHTVEINYGELPFSVTTDGALDKISSDYEVQGMGGSSGDGGASGTVSRIPEREGAVWTPETELAALPVFKMNGGFRGFFSAEKYIPILEKYAAALGEELTDVKYYDIGDMANIFGEEYVQKYKGMSYELTARAGETKFEVTCTLRVGTCVMIQDLPEDADILKIFGYENPKATLNNGYVNFVYEASDDEYANILNSMLKYVQVFGNGSYIYSSEVMNVLDGVMYPVLTAKQAVEELKKGTYVSQGKNLSFSGELEDIEAVTLDYKFTNANAELAPFYTIYAKTDGGYYEFFCVPAVEPKYLSNTNSRVSDLLVK